MTIPPSFRLAAFGSVLALAACALPAADKAAPTSMMRFGVVVDNHMPESANSLPLGSEVAASLTSVSGQLNTVAVGNGAAGNGPGAAPFRY